MSRLVILLWTCASVPCATSYQLGALPLLKVVLRTRAPIAAAPDGLRWYVKTESFVKDKSFAEIKPHLMAHKEWVAGLRASGSMRITSGYRVDENDRPGGGGLMLFAASDYGAALTLVKQDPLVANGCVDWQLNRWIPEVGDISLVDGGTWYEK